MTEKLGPFELGKVHCVNCIEAMKLLPEGSVDLIVTDPPYPKEFMKIWEPFAEGAARVLREGRCLITLCGHYQLPVVLDALRKHLTYRWICTLPNNLSPIMHGWNIKVCSKPILWFIKPPAKQTRLMCDNFSYHLKRDAKWEARHLHHWGQTLDMAFEPIAALTDPGDIVLDPFMGSGTTGVACNYMSRQFLGFEIEPEHAQLANERIEAAGHGLTVGQRRAGVITLWETLEREKE